MDINWVNLLLTGVISATVTGAVVLWNAQLERTARRKELLFSAAKDIALEIHRTEREKFSTLHPIVLNISIHYKQLNSLIESNGDVSPELMKDYEDSLKDPKIQLALKNDGVYQQGKFNIEPKKKGLVNKNVQAGSSMDRVAESDKPNKT